MSFTPEPPSEAKWTEMFTYGFKASGISADEMRSNLERAKEFEEGVDYTIVEVGETGFLLRATMPAHHASVVQRVVRRDHGAFTISYETRRQLKDGSTLKDWDAILSRSDLAVPAGPLIDGRIDPGSDAEISRKILGTWLRDETYSYGRFLGKLRFNTDGTGVRDFSVIDRPGAPVTPLLSETFRWQINEGFIVFSQRQVTKVEPGSAPYQTTKAGAEHREFVSFLSDTTMRTVDPKKKTDVYRKLEEGEQARPDNAG